MMVARERDDLSLDLSRRTSTVVGVSTDGVDTRGYCLLQYHARRVRQSVG